MFPAISRAVDRAVGKLDSCPPPPQRVQFILPPLGVAYAFVLGTQKTFHRWREGERPA